jgi:hypothetical protein
MKTVDNEQDWLTGEPKTSATMTAYHQQHTGGKS